jgi:6-phosphogluconolactonase/glucosamine-6-phosphate isomerase/deaminase
VSFIVQRFDREDRWIDSILARIEGLAGAAAEEGRRDFHLCLSGGSTPAPLYRVLAASPRLSGLSERLQFHVWPGDERMVPADSPQRNGRMIAEALGLVKGGAGQAWPRPPRLHPWPSWAQEKPQDRAQDDAERESVCNAYAHELRETFSPAIEAPAAVIFDIVILGMGTDGHTAGLFTIDDCERTELVLASLAPSEPRLRMTLGARLLARSGECMILARGEDKKAVLDRILAGEDVPLVRVAERGSTFYLLET